MARSWIVPAARRHFANTAPTPPLNEQNSRSAPRQLALAELPQLERPLQPSIPLRQLWLGIALPNLALEALLDVGEPAAVFEEYQGVRKILLANRQAAAVGVEAGMPINAALALLPTIRLEERNPAREAAVLEELAAWAETLTSFVCIEPPALLLLEIAGSLNIFGGLKALRQRVLDELAGQGFAAGVAIAPTPLAATWLARAGRKVCIRDPANLAGRLGRLPLECLAWPEKISHALQGMGITTIGEAFRLPRQGFAKRFGALRLLEFDRALGRLPDPRSSYRTPERFISDVDLNEEQSDSSLLLQVCRELLVRLEGFLLARQLAVQEVQFSFFHLQQAATSLDLGGVQASRDARHWFDLLEIRFERVVLPAPVIAIRLTAGRGQSSHDATATLPFKRGGQVPKSPSMAHLAERLSARIGAGAVHGVAVVAEHRPHYAWQACQRYDRAGAADDASPATSPYRPETLADIRRTHSLVLRRPLWMLDAPLRLESHHCGPCYQGPLTLVAGPERLETGWWDEQGIARDYYVAVNPGHVYLWIYQDRSGDRDWYLQGMFG